jgi:hypothetical protein
MTKAQLEDRNRELVRQVDRLFSAIKEHHAQKADDRCWEDDLKLYLAAGLHPCDRRVGDKAAMLANCARFIERRCTQGHWPSYVDLERRIRELEDKIAGLETPIGGK